MEMIIIVINIMIIMVRKLYRRVDLEKRKINKGKCGKCCLDSGSDILMVIMMASNKMMIVCGHDHSCKLLHIT